MGDQILGRNFLVPKVSTLFYILVSKPRFPVITRHPTFGTNMLEEAVSEMAWPAMSFFHTSLAFVYDFLFM